MKLNLLLDPLPESVWVEGERTPIRTDFRIGILFEQLMEDGRLPPAVRIAQALRLYFQEEDVLGRAPGKLYRAALWFHAGGEAIRQEAREAARVYDFDADAPLLYAAFLAQYGVDLQDMKEMHWWKFRAMFMGLESGHELVRRMAVRGMRLSDAGGPAERARLARLKALYRIEEQRTEKMEEQAGAVFLGPSRGPVYTGHTGRG